MRKRLYQERNSNARKNVRVMGFRFFFQFAFRMIIVHFSFVYNISLMYLLKSHLELAIWNIIICQNVATIGLLKQSTSNLVGGNNYNKVDRHVEIICMVRSCILQGLEDKYLLAPPFFFFILQFKIIHILNFFVNFGLKVGLSFQKQTSATCAFTLY